VSAAPVVRIDQAMAERAVDLVGPGGRIVVLATLASTVGPTIRLVERSANDAGTGVGVDVRLLEEAGRAREAGDDDRHDALVTEGVRSEEHTSELQSRENLVCRLLLEK